MPDLRSSAAVDPSDTADPDGGGPRDPLTPRPHLVARLRHGTRSAVTVISAPAGYGKSTLVTEWADSHRGVPVALIELGRDETGPRLAGRLLRALAHLGAPPAPAADTPGPLIRPGLVRALTAVRAGILVLDGYDAPADVELVGELASLIALAPSGLRLVVTCRGRGPAGEVLRVAHGEATVLDQSDLAFTLDGARHLLGATSGRSLTDDHVRLVLERTEGWAAGLHAIALDLADGGEIDVTLARLLDEGRHRTTYLFHELVSAQPESVRRFLLHTSVLDRMCDPLCAAVTGADARRMLVFLERRGLFTRREAPRSPWFASHGLLRAQLRRELRQHEPEAEPGLLRRAAAWHAEHGDPEPAARYLIQADDHDGLRALIDRVGRTMLERGGATVLGGWFDALPDPGPGARAGQALRRATVHTMAAETRRAEHVLRELEAADASPGQLVVADALRTTWGLGHAGPVATMRVADAVLDVLEDPEPLAVDDVFGMFSATSLRVMAFTAHARARWHLGEVTAARKLLTGLLGDRDAYVPWRLHVIGALALLEAWAGNLRMAHRHARVALTAAPRLGLARHPSTVDARLALAHIARERLQLRRAGEILDGLEDLVPVGPRQPVAVALLTAERLRWHLAVGTPEHGLAELERLRSMGLPPRPPLIAAFLRAGEIRAVLAGRGPERAWDLADVGADLEPPEYTAAAVQALVATGDVAGARRRLTGGSDTAPELRDQLQHELWAAILDLEDGDRRGAVRRGAAVVAHARVEGHGFLFTEAGRPADRLLRAILADGPSAQLRELVERTGVGAKGAALHGLSERELEVLRFLSTGQSNADIAAHLFISLNTLKTHLRAIYRKLGVRGRREAVVRAAELGLV